MPVQMRAGHGASCNSQADLCIIDQRRGTISVCGGKLSGASRTPARQNRSRCPGYDWACG